VPAGLGGLGRGTELSLLLGVRVAGVGSGGWSSRSYSPDREHYENLQLGNLRMGMGEGRRNPNQVVVGRGGNGGFD